MKLDATPETVAAVAEVFKLAAFLDDRIAQPDKARLAAWAEQVQRHKLTESDLLDGVQAFYDTPSERAMQVGDLIHHARAVRRERREREREADLAAAEKVVDKKAADDMTGIATDFTLGPALNRTPRLNAAQTALQCAVDRETAVAAMREFSAAKAEARKAAS